MALAPRRAPAPIEPVRVVAYTATSAVGRGRAALRDALQTGRGGLTANDFGPQRLDTYVGRVAGVEQAPLPSGLSDWECRNNRLAWLGCQGDDFIAAVARARARHGAERIALVVGTSTSSIGATEEAYRSLDPDGGFPAASRNPLVHTPHSLGMFLQQAFDLAGPCVTVSTACSSSAKVFAQAERMLRLALVDAAVVAGVDTLCGSVLFGFHALQLVSAQPCRPFDAERDGISLGEAAGFALLERAGGAADADGLLLLGYGESSDAHHMSSPRPDGLGAERAIDDALARAGLDAAAIDYINLHGTASTKNDEVEAALVARRFGDATAASSTKGFVGHTLGAAGIVEAVISLLAIEHGLVPGTLNCRTPDPACGPQLVLRARQRPVRRALSNSFGFGGSNCALIFGDRRAA